jgi:hypothetical protein
MESVHVYDLKTLINEYGARETLKGFIEALKSCADEYSDLGLKARAYEAAEVAELLSDVEDIAGAGSPEPSDDIV